MTGRLVGSLVGSAKGRSVDSLVEPVAPLQPRCF
jgi:hypothetical protein